MQVVEHECYKTTRKFYTNLGGPKTTPQVSYKPLPLARTRVGDCCVGLRSLFRCELSRLEVCSALSKDGFKDGGPALWQRRPQFLRMRSSFYEPLAPPLFTDPSERTLQNEPGKTDPANGPGGSFVASSWATSPPSPPIKEIFRDQLSGEGFIIPTPPPRHVILVWTT